MSGPDPKAPPRIVDRGASLRKLLLDPWCRACGERATNCHHLIGKAQGGDDVPDCLVPLCGSGSHGDHGALHGNPRVDRSGRRWEAQDVRRAIGLTLRPSEYAYVLQKLSRPSRPGVGVNNVDLAGNPDFEPGREFLRERYFAEVDTLMPFRMREVLTVAPGRLTPA